MYLLKRQSEKENYGNIFSMVGFHQCKFVFLLLVIMYMYFVLVAATPHEGRKKDNFTIVGKIRCLFLGQHLYTRYAPTEQKKNNKINKPPNPPRKKNPSSLLLSTV